MADPLFKLDYKGIGEGLVSAPMRAAVHEAALHAATVAGELAAPHSKTGRFAASIHVEDGTLEGRSRRAVSYVVADDPAAVPIEFGTSDTEGLHVLGRAISQGGAS